MNKAGGSRLKILASLISLIIIVTVAFGLLRVSSILSGRQVRKAIQTGEIVMNSKEDINKYFVFLSGEEARLLLEGQSAEKAVFLFPQIDFIFGDRPIVIKQENASVEGRKIDFITFSGLSLGTRIYLGEKSALKGATASDYAWFTERAESRPVFAKTTYVAASSALGGLLAKLDHVYKFFPAGEPVASLNVGTEMNTPIRSQIAVYISDGERNDYALFGNMLRKGGRFVMVKR